MALKLPLLAFPLRSFVFLGILRAIMVLLVVVTLSVKRLGSHVQSVELFASRLDECPLNLSSKSSNDMPKPGLRLAFSPLWATPAALKGSSNLTVNVFSYLVGEKLLNSSARALCVGEGSSSAVSALRNLGVSESFGVDEHVSFSILKLKFFYELKFKDEHFDFVFSGNLDRVCLPSLVVIEIERVLVPGGIGALLLAGGYSGNMISPAATLTSFLKRSDVVDSCRIGSYSLVIFRKRTETLTVASSSFAHFRLPDDCPSIAMNKPFMKYIEPLNRSSTGELAYLPKMLNISSRKGLVYINIGAGEYARTSIQKISELYRFNQPVAFEKFVVHYIPSISYTYVPEPGINLILYQPPGEEAPYSTPELASEVEMDEFIDEEEFHLMRWFQETVSGEKFVILMMNAKMVELNILEELFRTGAICYVDELFLQCSDVGNCTTTLESLRQNGVYAHPRFV